MTPSDAAVEWLDMMQTMTGQQYRDLMAQHDVGHLDQTLAARDEAWAAAAGNGATYGADLVTLGRPTALMVLTQLIEWIDGDSRTCRHSPHPSRPRPIYAVAWRPGLVVCAECRHMLTEPRRRICDMCGGSDGPIFHTETAWSVLTYLMRICPDCSDEDERQPVRIGAHQ